MLVGVEAELPHEHEGLLSGDHLHLGVAAEDLLHAGSVVGLHVVDHQPVQGLVAQQVVQVVLELAVGGPVYRVKEDGLLVQQQVGVVGNPPGDGVDVFKQVEPVVVGPHPIQIVRYLAHAIHCDSSFCSLGLNELILALGALGADPVLGRFSNRVPGAISASSSPSSGMYS